ncbi:MAG: 6-pyruvoyl-tetrahydropterin synthase-related protein, partial [Patescibacteria group bacterium]
MKKNIFFKIKKEIPLAIVILAVLLVGWALTKPGYFSMHDDIQVMRLFEMERCFKDGQIPCRWVPDMGAGYGHPLFNYHPVFPYYLGMIFRLFGLSFLVTAKILFFLSFLLSAVFMYFLAKEFFGKWAGMTAGVFYILAPYYALDVYVRGALTEAWAISFFPLILWGIYKLVKTNKFSYLLLNIFSLTVLFLSHNIMIMIFSPIALIWGIYWAIQAKKIKRIFSLGVAFLWAVGLSAFFLLPAFFEKSLVTIGQQNSGYYNFRDHFATLRQLFIDRSWGYGPSRIGPDDDLSFQLGWPYWQLVIVAFGAFLWQLKDKKFFRPLAFFLALFSIAIFMTHAKSVFLWQGIPLLSFVQFPWRFLAIAMLASSFIVGALVGIFKRVHWQILLALILVSGTLFLNLGYFYPQKYDLQMTDSQKLNDEEWQIQSRATLSDYVPVGVKTMPAGIAPENPWIIEGEAKITGFQKRSNFWRFTVEVIGRQDVVVEVPVFDFSVWQIFVDSQETAYQVNPETGLIQVKVPVNKRTVTGWLKDTPLRKMANTLSL